MKSITKLLAFFGILFIIAGIGAKDWFFILIGAGCCSFIYYLHRMEIKVVENRNKD